MPLSPPPPEVEAVVIYPPRLPPLGGEAAFAVKQLDTQVLQVALRLDDALRQEPGVSLFRRTGSGAANPTIQGVSLRGIGPTGAGRALVTLDGAPQNDPFGGWVIWSALPPEGLGSATIVRGAGAGAYGAGALTGVIALTDRPTGGGLQALDLAASERGGGRAVAAYGAPGLLVTVAGETSDGYVPVRSPSRGAADTPTGLHSDSLSARLQREVDGVTAAVRVGAFEERRGAGLAGADSRATGANASFTLASLQNGGGWRAQAWIFSSDLQNSSVSVSANRATTTPANDEFSTPALGYGVNAAWQGRQGPWSWELGADARFADGHEKEFFRFLNGAFTRLREAGGRTEIGGVYAEGVLERGDLLLTGGARVDAWRQSDAIRRERDAATGALTLDSSAPSNSGVTPTARLGARWTLSGDTWIRTAAYAGFRPPTLNELHRPFRVGNDVTEANPELTPEKLYGVEAGIGGGDALRWTATAFFNRLNDPVTNVTLGIGPGTFPIAGVVPAGGAFRKRENAGRIDAYGLEGDATRGFGAFTLEGAFSATHARVDGENIAPQLTGKRPAETPRLSATASLHWRASERLTLSGAAIYESARYDDDLNTRRIAPSAELDVRAGWRLAQGSEVYLAIQNLADAKIEVGQTADGITSLSAPRTVRVGFALRR